MIHINVLRAFGQSVIYEGSQVELIVQESPRGLQATEILSITPSENPLQDEPPPMGATHCVNLSAATGPFLPARIKWFDKTRGFGFVTIFGNPMDVFVHMETLRQCLISDLQAGEAVAVRTGEGPRGKMVTEIRPWESVMMDDPPPPEYDVELEDTDILE